MLASKLASNAGSSVGLPAFPMSNGLEEQDEGSDYRKADGPGYEDHLNHGVLLRYVSSLDLSRGRKLW
jgi:hypothetical protein